MTAAQRLDVGPGMACPRTRYLAEPTSGGIGFHLPWNDGWHGGQRAGRVTAARAEAWLGLRPHPAPDPGPTVVPLVPRASACGQWSDGRNQWGPVPASAGTYRANEPRTHGRTPVPSPQPRHFSHDWRCPQPSPAQRQRRRPPRPPASPSPPTTAQTHGSHSSSLPSSSITTHARRSLFASPHVASIAPALAARSDDTLLAIALPSLASCRRAVFLGARESGLTRVPLLVYPPATRTPGPVFTHLRPDRATALRHHLLCRRWLASW